MFKLQPPKAVVKKGSTLTDVPSEPAKQQTALISFDQPSEGSIDSKTSYGAEEEKERPLSGPGDDEYSVPSGSIDVEPRAPGTPKALDGFTDISLEDKPSSRPGTSENMQVLDEPAASSVVDGTASSPKRLAQASRVQ